MTPIEKNVIINQINELSKVCDNHQNSKKVNNFCNYSDPPRFFFLQIDQKVKDPIKGFPIS